MMHRSKEIDLARRVVCRHCGLIILQKDADGKPAECPRCAKTEFISWRREASRGTTEPTRS
jgi:hypothetical protein